MIYIAISILFVIMILSAYLAVKIWMIPTERYNAYRSKLNGWRGVMLGYNNIPAEDRYDGLCVNSHGGIILKQTYTYSATERLFK